eukprot:CFRG6677T1
MSSSLGIPVVAKKTIKRSADVTTFDPNNINECVGQLRQSVEDVLQVASVVFSVKKADHYGIPTYSTSEGTAHKSLASIETSLLEFEEMCDNVYALVLTTRNQLLSRINDDYGLGYDIDEAPIEIKTEAVKQEPNMEISTADPKEDAILADDKYLSYCATLLSQVTSTMVVIDKLTEFVKVKV